MPIRTAGGCNLTDHALPDPGDLHILDALQDAIPLEPRPFATIAQRIGIPEKDLLDRLKWLQDEGIIRGISPTIESRHMGLTAATLVAFHVPDERVHEIATIINSYQEVSHNFLREHYYNLWFTLSGKNDESIKRVFTEILQRTGVPDTNVMNLPTVRKLKVDVRFSFFKNRDQEGTIG
ncbi:MAG TPA: Lrp/AsnC family transcriptional regulator [Methanoregulaceae archaeon]|nr:Lrp/AsnC family transcriptional regulator [Methanoregulaceae archaeon]